MNSAEEEDQQDLRDHVKALASSSQVPEELKTALSKFAAQDTLKHSDINKANKYKSLIAKARERLHALEQKWNTFQDLTRKNWTKQREKFSEERNALIQGMKVNKEKLAVIQKEMAEKAGKEEDSDVEIIDTERFFETSGIPPWDEEDKEDEEPDNSMEEEEPTNGAGGPLQPFGRPQKIQKKA